MEVNRIRDAWEKTSASIDGSEFDNDSIEGLTPDQQNRLTHLLDHYLVGLEAGCRPDVDELLADHGDLRDIFIEYLGKLESLFGVVVNETNRSEDPNLPIRELGEYQIVRVVGRGGMGLVYEAVQASLDRRVAIKVLPFASSFDQTQVARFQNEARSAGLLKHPHIVPIYSVGTDAGLNYFAMQFIDGVTVEDDIQRQIESGAGRSWQETVTLIADAADALDHAHRHGIVHRDIKPSNLMLDATEKIWVTDFGLAQCSSSSSMTTSGDMLGTVRYMSPEQAAGKSAMVDGRCDIYSLATTLYEMLAMRPAFESKTPAELLRQIDEHEVLPLKKLRADLPADLTAVVTKAMSRGRDDRYETSEDFASDLRRVLAGQPTFAKPPSLVDLAIRRAARHTRVVCVVFSLFIVALLGLSAATVTFASLKTTADNQATRAETKERLARAAVERLGSDTAKLLEEIPAADDVRRRLLAETLSYYQQLAADSRSDQFLAFELAVTLGKIGVLQAELGETANAIESLTDSERSFAVLQSQRPSDAGMQLEWSISQNNLGDVFAGDGQYEAATRCYTKAIKIQRQLITQSDAGDRARIQLATSLNNLGVLLTECDAPDHAADQYSEAVNVIDGLQNCELLRASIQRNLSKAIAQTHPARAIELAQLALATYTRRLDQQPSNSLVAHEVVVSLDRLGSAHLAAGQLKDAYQSFQTCAQIAGQLEARTPGHPKSLRCLVSAWNHLGLVSARRERFALAVKELQRSQQYADQLLKALPNHAGTQSLIASLSSNVASIHQQRGNEHATARSLRQAILHQRNAVSLAPEVAKYRQTLEEQQRQLKQVQASIRSRLAGVTR